MSGFLYCIPGVVKPDLATIGLGHIADASVTVNHLASGPGNQEPCLLLAPNDASGSRAGGYYPERQTWADCGKFWLGYENDSPPTPADVIRPDPIDGHRVMLERQWEVIVPLARRFPAGTALPETLMIGLDGALVRKPLARFAALSQGAETIFNQWILEDKPISFEILWAICVPALIVNYQISSAEISLLELITTTNIATIAEALIDMPTVRAAIEADLKKN